VNPGPRNCTIQLQTSPEREERFFSLTVEELIRGHAIARSSCRLLQSAKNASSLWQLRSESGAAQLHDLVT
jgi:hypothetical protein